MAVIAIGLLQLTPPEQVAPVVVGFVLLNTRVHYMGIEMTAKVNKVMLVGELVVLATLRGLLRLRELPEDEWLPLDEIQGVGVDLKTVLDRHLSGRRRATVLSWCV